MVSLQVLQPLHIWPIFPNGNGFWLRLGRVIAYSMKGVWTIWNVSLENKSICLFGVCYLLVLGSPYSQCIIWPPYYHRLYVKVLSASITHPHTLYNKIVLPLQNSNIPSWNLFMNVKEENHQELNNLFNNF